MMYNMSMLYAIIIGIILVICVVILVSLEKTKPTSNWKSFTQNRLQEIDAHTDFDNYMSLKAAVIDLDSLLDHALKNSRLNGQTMGERLKAAHSMFERSLYNEIWTAHKMRNQLVHEPSFKPTLGHLKQSHQALKKAIMKCV